MRSLLLVLTVLGLGCRTEIRPRLKGDGVKSAAPAPKPSATGRCEVDDRSHGDEVPAGAKSLGTVEVPRAETDEKTFEALRAAICAKGGNAFTRSRWLRGPGVSLGDRPSALEAAAWYIGEQ